MKFTPWFPPEIEPVRVGWYACQQCTIARAWRNRHYWDGKKWRHSETEFGLPVTIEFRWRGLANRHQPQRQQPK